MFDNSYKKYMSSIFGSLIQYTEQIYTEFEEENLEEKSSKDFKEYMVDKLRVEQERLLQESELE